MVCNRFKGGIGTASRRLGTGDGGYTVGVLVQCNYGARAPLRIAGVPVGREITDLMPCREPCSGARSEADPRLARDLGSIIIVVATDAPLLPHQLKRIAKRAALGVGRLGGLAANSSGDIFIAFSTANAAPLRGAPLSLAEFMANSQLDDLFRATVQATEEAIVNALVAAKDMQGTEGHYAIALPHADLVALLEHYGRLVK